MLEQVLLDIMYDLPSMKKSTKVVVDEAVVNRCFGPPFPDLQRRAKSSSRRRTEIPAFRPPSALPTRGRTAGLIEAARAHHHRHNGGIARLSFSDLGHQRRPSRPVALATRCASVAR